MSFHYIKLNRVVATPLYYQLEMCMEQANKEGILKPHEKLPTEEELCKRFRISRPVVRQAYADLINKGMIARHKGKGTFVKEPEIKGSFFKELMSFHTEMEKLGLEARTDLLKSEILEKDAEAQRELQLSEQEPVFHMRRLRFGNDIALVLVDTYLPAKQFKGIEAVDFEKEALYDVLEKRYHVSVMRATRTIEACIVDSKDAALLKVGKQSAVHKVITIAYDDNDVPIEYSVAIYPGERNVFDVDIRK